MDSVSTLSESIAARAPKDWQGKNLEIVITTKLLMAMSDRLRSFPGTSVNRATELTSRVFRYMGGTRSGTGTWLPPSSSGVRAHRTRLIMKKRAVLADLTRALDPWLDNEPFVEKVACSSIWFPAPAQPRKKSLLSVGGYTARWIGDTIRRQKLIHVMGQRESASVAILRGQGRHLSADRMVATLVSVKKQLLGNENPPHFAAMKACWCGLVSRLRPSARSMVANTGRPVLPLLSRSGARAPVSRGSSPPFDG
jgi:hypothetical protein